MKRSIFVTVAAAAVIACSPGVASAHGVNDPAGAPYCGPGKVWVGVNGDALGCARTVLPPDPRDDSSFLAAISAAWVAAMLLI